MSKILEHLQGHAVRRFEPGDKVLDSGKQSGILLVLIDGVAEVRKNGTLVDIVKEPGSVLGEIAALLETGHSADVIASQPASFYVIENPRSFLRENPDFHLHVSTLLAKRLGNLVQYLGDVKQQYEGHDHIGMVDQVLETILHRQLRRRGG